MDVIAKDLDQTGQMPWLIWFFDRRRAYDVETVLGQCYMYLLRAWSVSRNLFQNMSDAQKTASLIFEYHNDPKFSNSRYRQTLQTQIRLLLEEQSDQGLHCSLFHLHLFDEKSKGLSSFLEF